jgi:GMP synthase (glutamine-hydrolysing)
MTEPARQPTVALVVHGEHSDPGRIATHFAARGWALKRCCAKLGDCLPEPAAIDAAVVFGGPMSANDDGTLPFIAAELRWIDRVLAAGTPYFGICLGAQMMARALGARVAPHDAGMMEIGYWPIEPTVAGAPVIDSLRTVYHWHGEGFALPAGAELLAKGETFPNQAIRFGPKAYGVQFHPEVTRAILERWSGDAHESLQKPGAQCYATQMEGCAKYDAALDKWTAHFLDVWLGKPNGSRD